MESGFTEADQEKVYEAASSGATKRRMGLGFAPAPKKPKPHKATATKAKSAPPPKAAATAPKPSEQPAAPEKPTVGCVIAGQQFDDKSAIWTYIKDMQQQLEDGMVRNRLAKRDRNLFYTAFGV